jgi:uncharacterized protein YjbJ (UPF0337 family)
MHSAPVAPPLKSPSSFLPASAVLFSNALEHLQPGTAKKPVFRPVEHGHRICTSSVVPKKPFSFEQKEIVMNWDTVAGNWTQFRGKVKEQWGKLTDDEIDMIAGQRDQLVGRIQEAYGIGRDEAERQINGFEKTLH